MLPGQLVSAYQQYKKDTDSVASWLASTAKACGYPADLLSKGSWDPSQQAPAKKGGGARLKGKARKEAKAASASTETSKPTCSKSKYVVAIADFLPLAQFIAASKKPRVPVPDSFSAVINRVIDARSGFGHQLADHGADPDPDADAKHGYFVGILEGVRDALRPRMSTAVASATSAGAGGKAADHLANKFSGLDVFEPSQAFLDAPDVERPRQASGDETIYELEPQLDFDDVMFAFALMLDDLNRIRSVIKSTWKSHAQGMFDLVAAAVATNTAIDLARGIIEDALPLFAAHKGPYHLLNTLYLGLCITKGHTNDPSRLRVADMYEFNDDTYEIADGMGMVAYQMLKSFQAVLEPDSPPLYKEGSFGFYNPSSNRATKSGREKFQEDQVLLLSFFSELMCIVRLVPEYPPEDEFLRGIKELDKSQQIPFYLVFAAQVFLDIHHNLRADAYGGLDIVLREISFHIHNVERHLQYHKNLKIGHWTPHNDRMLETFVQIAKWVAEDPVYKIKVEFIRQNGLPMNVSGEPHRLLRYSPVMAGLLLFKLRAEVHKFGIAAANAWASIQIGCHLYHTLERQKLLERPWPDMDMARSMLKNSSFFAGSPPTTLQEGYKSFCLQMGVSVAALAGKLRMNEGSTKKKNMVIASRAGPRGINNEALLPVSSVFYGRYVTNTGGVDWTPGRISDIISRSEYAFEGSEEEGNLTLTQVHDDPKALKSSSANKQGQATRNRSPPTVHELVKSLARALQAETLEMLFPYLMLHRTCWTLLRGVKTQCNSVLMKRFGPNYMEKETELPFILGYIFQAACLDGRGKSDLRPLHEAARAFNSVPPENLKLCLTLLEKMGHAVEFEEESDSEDGNDVEGAAGNAQQNDGKQ